MKILFLTSNNECTLARWIKVQNQSDSIVLVTDKLLYDSFATYSPDIVISYSYRYIVASEILKLSKAPFINLHISYLPFNRGADPNIWSFLEDTPKGVTIHLMDDGIDTGPILFQRKIQFADDSITLRESYEILQYEIQELFKQNWHFIISGNYEYIQTTEVGTYHSRRDFEGIKSKLMKSDGWDVSVGILRSRYLDL